MNPDKLEQLAADWGTDLRDAGSAPNTVRTYVSSVRALAAWQRKNGREGLDPEGVRGFSASILDSGGSRNTANIRVRSIRAFSAWLLKTRAVTADEVAGLKAPRPGRKPVSSPADDATAALISACAANGTVIGCRDEAVVRFMRDTGARADELLQMNLPGDLLLDTRRARLLTTKRDKPRLVPYDDGTSQALQRYLQMRRGRDIPDEGPLWLSMRGTRLSYSGLYAALMRRSSAAGLSDEIRPHQLRRAMVRGWLRAGGSEGSLMKLCGWESRAMIDVYAGEVAAEIAIEEHQRLFGQASGGC